MGFGNLGISEIAIIAILVLLFFGPERIPEMARTVGQLMREFRRGVNEIQRELQEVERSVSGGPESGSEEGEGRQPPEGRLEPSTWEPERPEGGPGGAPDSEPDVRTPGKYRPVQDVPPPGADPDAGPDAGPDDGDAEGKRDAGGGPGRAGRPGPGEEPDRDASGD